MKFKAGTYYVGDLCYVISNTNWIKLLEETNYLSDGGIYPYKTEKLWSHRTAHGDGIFSDCCGNKYNVDAGIIGILLVELMDKQSDGGNIITFEKDFEPKYDDGIFYIGHLTIDTYEDEDDENNDDCENYCRNCGYQYRYCSCSCNREEYEDEECEDEECEDEE